MGYKIEQDLMYMMPTHFGPMSGPRQGPDLKPFGQVASPKSTTYTVSFLTRADRLEALCPPGFTVAGEPVVTVASVHMTEVEWLAGRGYNVLGVMFPVAYSGEQDRAAGPLLAVLWENLADPILTGREQIGFAKIYAEIPAPIVRGNETHLSASWLGFRFVDIEIRNLVEVPAADYPPPPARERDGVALGMLHYKYIPGTGPDSPPDAQYAVLQPNGNSQARTTGLWRGEGSVRFHEARWEDLPTQYRIVNTLAALEIQEARGASLSTSIGGEDYSRQRRLR
jgi:hypothetical protein